MSEKNLNEKIKDLDKMVAWFESEEFKLDEAVDNYKKALELATEIEEDLKSLKNEIEVLDEDFTRSA